MNRLIIGFGVSFGLAGCFSKEEESFPDLQRNEVIGCWSKIDPEKLACSENCYDSGGLFYYKSRSNMDTTSFHEAFGTYVIKGNAIETSYMLTNNRFPSIRDSGSGRTYYARIRDTLFVLGGGGRYLTGTRYLRADITVECGGAWINFQQPSDWYSQ